MPEVLVVGLTARALTQSARAAGYAPLAADLFCDLDTRAAAERSIRIPCDLAQGLQWRPLIAALERLAAGHEPIGIVCGSGFEARHRILDRLGERWPLLGNGADTVARVKAPSGLAGLCRRCGIAQPPWSTVPQSAGWLRKRIGGAGGSHIGAGEDGTDEHYWQKAVAGAPVSALVLGAGRSAMVLGLSDQWSDPAPGAPYRYGGAVRPAARPAVVAAELGEAAAAIAEEAGLLGLNSIDFLVGPDGSYLIDVNPRPGATLDIYRPAGASLFALHVEASRGRLPVEAPAFEGAAASRIVYASRPVRRIPEIDWPEWAADRQPPGTALRAGDPVCTVLAEADTPSEARRLVGERGRAIAVRIGAG